MSSDARPRVTRTASPPYHPPEDPDRHRGSRRDHRRRAAARAADARVRRRRLRQDAARHGVPARGATAIRRARRVHELRGDRRGAAAERPLARLRPRPRWRAEEARSSTTCGSSAARSRRPANTTSRGSSSGSAPRSTRSARSAWCSTRSSRCSAGSNEAHPARRAAPPVPLAQGPRRHGGHHRRARRRPADAAGPRGVRLGLRAPARPPRRRPALHAAAAHREVPRLARTARTSTRS